MMNMVKTLILEYFSIYNQRLNLLIIYQILGTTESGIPTFQYFCYSEFKAGFTGLLKNQISFFSFSKFQNI
jgi:hypothetical protein